MLPAVVQKPVDSFEDGESVPSPECVQIRGFLSLQEIHDEATYGISTWKKIQNRSGTKFNLVSSSSLYFYLEFGIDLEQNSILFPAL